VRSESFEKWELMANEQDLNWIANFLWGIADDVLRDYFKRGKYADFILPMTVLTRLDTVLEPTKAEVLAMHVRLDEMGVVNQEAALRMASGFPFYNTSKFSLSSLRNRSNPQQLHQDFLDWLDGFSESVQDIIENFKFRRNQVPDLAKANLLGPLIEKFLDPQLKVATLDNHAMGTVFEELVRRFNEANNEEAGEHWTPRDVVKLMSNLIFRPVADQLTSGTYLLYDSALGTGGMLTVAEQTLRELGEERGLEIATHLYGQEINPETFAICKSDLLLSGDGAQADNIRGGTEYSTLSNDAFAGQTFDFMLSNPPYGKSWKVDLERMGGKSELNDPRFVVNHGDDPSFSFVPRSSDGQMLFLANMVSKMKTTTPLGSRIAEIHSGSSLFTGDAGQGESNLRRYLFERDLVDAVIQLPEKLFYNTGIATYIWVLANRKATHRQGKVQLIDASSWFTPRQKNLGAKNCDLSPEDIERIISTYLAFEETEQSKIFANEDFGYRKVKVERPLRLCAQLSAQAVEGLRFASGDQEQRQELYDLFGDDLFTSFSTIRSKVEEHLDAGDDDEEDVGIPAKTRKRLLDEKKWGRDFKIYEVAQLLVGGLGTLRFDDFNEFSAQVDDFLKEQRIKLSAGEKKALLQGVSWVDPEAPKVIKKISKPAKAAPNPLAGLFEVEIHGENVTAQYEPDSDLSDFELIPLSEPGGVAAFIEREVLPYAEDAWVDLDSEKIGYEVSFTRHFYRPAALRELSVIEAEIRDALSNAERLVEGALNG
jgi:type I restriction enzyme M protein